MKHKFSILALFLFLFSVTGKAAEIIPRIKGLEKNEEYMQLLNQEHSILQKQDSLTKRVAEVRDMFRSQSENRSQLGKEIINLESEIFDIRNQAGAINSKINQIEQAYIVESLGQNSEGEKDSVTNNNTPINSGRQQNNNPNLIYNDYFRLRLSPEDYNSLIKAQEKEKSIANYIKIYTTNYSALKQLEEEYRSTEIPTEADSLFIKIKSTNSLISTISDSISASFDYVLENKAYAYNYLLDRSNNMETLSDFEQKSLKAKEDQLKLTLDNIDPSIAIYRTGKQLIFEYELTFASYMNMADALDSLKKAEKDFNKTDFDLRKLDIRERLFLDYQNIEFKNPSSYNASNPIPLVNIYPKGIIYRILLGTYPRTQPVSLFRGIYPLGYLKENTKYLYYAGGYKTLNEAIEGLKSVKSIGFRKAKLVIWNYGDYIELDDEEDKSMYQYRVSLSNVKKQLPESVTEKISAEAGDKEVSRVGNDIIIGAFPTAFQAEIVADKLRGLNDSLSIKITPIN